MVRDDAELGPVRHCPRCDEEWPDDADFYARGDYVCIACRIERRMERWRKAARSYRARQRTMRSA